MPHVPRKVFFVESVYGAQTRQPLVRISYEGKEITMINPQDAVMLAINLIQAANASITDAFLFDFMTDLADEPRAAAVMAEFRKWRSDHNYDLDDNLMQGKRRGH